jgi:hypothetical protein
MKKLVLSVAVPALMLMAAPAFAQSMSDQSSQTLQPPGGKSDPSIAAPTGGLQGAQTGAAHMNGKNGDGTPSPSGAIGDNSASNMSSSPGSSMAMSSPSVSANSQLSGSVDSSPTYQGGRAAYRGKSESSLNKSEAEITAQLNQQQSGQ